MQWFGGFLLCLCNLSCDVADEALGALNHAGVMSVIKSSPDSFEDAEIEKYKSSILKRLQDLRYESSSWEGFKLEIAFWVINTFLFTWLNAIFEVSV